MSRESTLCTESALSGDSGLSGLAGVSGLWGVSALSGDSGVSGLVGVSGLSGYSGDSGDSTESACAPTGDSSGVGSSPSAVAPKGESSDSPSWVAETTPSPVVECVGGSTCCNVTTSSNSGASPELSAATAAPVSSATATERPPPTIFHFFAMTMASLNPLELDFSVRRDGHRHDTGEFFKQALTISQMTRNHIRFVFSADAIQRSASAILRSVWARHLGWLTLNGPVASPMITAATLRLNAVGSMLGSNSRMRFDP